MSRGAVAPSLTFPDSEPIASVTLEPDAEPPVVSARILLPTQPRRGLALVGLAMGLAIVGVAVAGVKLLGGPKATPASVSTRQRLRPRRRAGDRGHRAGASATDPRGAGGAAAREGQAVPAKPPPRSGQGRARRATAREGQGRARHHRSCRRPAAGGRAGRGPSRHRPPRRQAESAPRGAGAEGRHEGPGCEAQRARRRRRRPSAAIRARHYERGNALLFAGDSKGAIAAYREAIRAAPADPSAFRGLGLAYEQQSEPVFAARALRRYLKLAPNAPDHEIVARRLERLPTARSESRPARDRSSA